MNNYIAHVYAALILNPKSNKTINDVPEHLREAVQAIIDERTVSKV